MPLSFLMLTAGVVLGLVGLGQAGERSEATLGLAVLVTAASTTASVWLLVWYVRRWLTGTVGARTRNAVLISSICVAVALFLMARTQSTGPVGVAALGGCLVGLMIGNLIAIRLARRQR